MRFGPFPPWTPFSNVNFSGGGEPALPPPLSLKHPGFSKDVCVWCNVMDDSQKLTQNPLGPKGPTSDNPVTRDAILPRHHSPRPLTDVKTGTLAVFYERLSRMRFLWDFPGWFCAWAREIGCLQERPGLDVWNFLIVRGPIFQSQFPPQSCRKRVHGCIRWSRALFCFLGFFA